MTRFARRAAAVAFASAITLGSVRGAHAAETYSGQDFRALARSTVDVMRAHQWLLRAQMERDEVPFFMNGIYRGMRAQLEMPNGSTLPGLVTRAGVENWGGSGNVASDFGIFYGVQLDALLAEPEQGSGQHMIADGLAFFGAGYHGFEGSVGLRFSWTRGFTKSGSFGGSDTTTRPGTPPAYAYDGGAVNDRFALTGVTLSTYHKEGVTLGAALGEAFVQAPDGTSSPETVLAAARALYQPEALMKRLELRRWLGIPGVGLERIAGQVDYYGDRYVAVREQAAAVANAAAAPAFIPTQTAALYEIPMSIDDLLSLGIRVKAVTQVAPTPLLRSGEVGWMWANDTFQVGARGAVVRRADAYGGAYDVFAGAAFHDFMLVGSLSYNSPDPSTSLPVPFARVIGLQLFWGPPDMARPLVPMLGVRKPKPKPKTEGSGE